MHVETSRSHQVLRDGTERTYERHLLRRSFRDGGKVRKETLANLSQLPPEAITAVRAVLAGKTLVDADAAFEVTRSLPHGHAAAVHAMARTLGFPALLGPPGRPRDLACALIISRVLRPASKLSTAGWWDDVTLGPDLGVAGASTDEIYAAMDWLVSRQDDIEKQLAARHLAEGGIAMSGLSSSWMEGSHCELAAYGYSRDGKRGKPQIEYGLLTDNEGRPVAVRVLAGNTADPKAFPEAVTAVRETFGLHKMIMVGDRGMITSARIKDLRELDGMAWITCLRHPAIKKLMAGGGPLQLSLSGEQDLAETTSPDFPGERLIACRNPFEAAKRARTRQELLAATEADLGKIAARVAAGRIKDPDKIGVAAGKVINKRKVAKHVILDIGEGRISWRRDQDSIDAEALTDGIYVIRTPVPAGHPRRGRRRGRLQGPGKPGTGLPAYQGRGPGPAPHLAPARGPRQRPRADLHARLLPELAPAPGLGAADLHRRTPARPRQPGRPGPPLTIGRGQGRLQDRPRQTAHPRLPRPDRPPRHPDPRHHHRRRPARRQARHPDPHPAPRLRPDRRAHPPDPHVDTSHPPSDHKIPGQRNESSQADVTSV